MQLPYFYEPSLKAGDVFFTLSGNTSRHCVQVLRMQTGARLLLTDGKGLLAEVILVTPHKMKSQVKIISTEMQASNIKKTCIAIGLLKNSSRMDWFLEKATELGISEIIPMITDYTEKVHFRQDRALSILAAAMIQSRQSYLPVLYKPLPYSTVIASTTYSQKLIAHCEDRPKTILSRVAISNEAQLLIGPEGDFSSEEINMAENVGFRSVSLGNNRLRTETAGIAGVVLLTINSNIQ